DRLGTAVLLEDDRLNRFEGTAECRPRTRGGAGSAIPRAGDDQVVVAVGGVEAAGGTGARGESRGAGLAGTLGGRADRTGHLASARVALDAGDHLLRRRVAAGRVRIVLLDRCLALRPQASGQYLRLDRVARAGDVAPVGLPRAAVEAGARAGGIDDA